MPSTSKKQHNFMAAVANSPSFAKKAGVPQSVGKEFNEADKGRKFSKGGDTMATKGMSAKMMAFEKSGKDVEKKGMKESSKADMALDKKQMMGMKRGGGVKKMAEGGMSDMAQDKTMIKKAFKQHDAQEHKGAKGTSLKLAKGGVSKMSAVKTAAPSKDGIAIKGKTQGTMVAMKRGGKAR